MNFTQFRVVEAHCPKSNVAHAPDGLFHLSQHAPFFRTLCERQVFNLTSIAVRDFGHPAVDADWCPDCISRLAHLEQPKQGGARKRQLRNGYFKRKLRELMEAGHTQREIAARLGVAQGTVRRQWAKLQAADLSKLSPNSVATSGATC